MAKLTKAEKSRAQRRARIKTDIEKHGWQGLHIFSEEAEEADFSYSLGFAESYNAPEILIFGLPRETAHNLLWQCCHLLREGQHFDPDVPDPRLLNGYAVVFRQIGREHFGEYLGTALDYYGDRAFTALVMFLPDRDHRFAWDAGYRGPPAREALLISGSASPNV